QAGTPVSCGDSNSCNGVESCDAVSGACNPGTPLVCHADAFSCTEANCKPASGCEQKPNHSFCQGLFGSKAKCQPNKKGSDPVTGCAKK
ncbi:MAG TPA: hypothetical protein VFW62_13530, partial [bacterium]|nr:hypothetical protein [bacterium]